MVHRTQVIPGIESSASVCVDFYMFTFSICINYSKHLCDESRKITNQIDMGYRNALYGILHL